MNTRMLSALAILTAMPALAQPEPQPEPQHVHAAPPVENFPTDPFQPDLTPGYVLFEGDIQVRLDQYLRIISGNTDGTFGTVTFWGNTIPFDFTANVSPANQALAIAAMTAIEAIAGIDFRPATAQDADRIRFQNSNFNNSNVGRIGGTQIINIFNWNTQVIIIHEIYHALGFWHEQSRPDRNTFITVNNNNICGSASSPACTAGPAPGCCFCTDGGGNCVPCAFNFGITAGASTYGPYDFGSIMHYGPTAFSCNGQNTITVNAPWNAQWQGVIGQRNNLSPLDTITCRGIYPFPGDRWNDAAWLGGQNGNFFFPFNATFTAAMGATPTNGTLFLNPGTYEANGLYTTAKAVRAPLGGVILR